MCLASSENLHPSKSGFIVLHLINAKLSVNLLQFVAPRGLIANIKKPI